MCYSISAVLPSGKGWLGGREYAERLGEHRGREYGGDLQRLENIEGDSPLRCFK